MTTETKKTKFNWFKMFWEGFTHMTSLGKTLWVLVIVKLIVMFFILKPYFSPNYLDTKYKKDDKAKSEYVGEELINKSGINK